MKPHKILGVVGAIALVGMTLLAASQLPNRT